MVISISQSLSVRAGKITATKVKAAEERAAQRKQGILLEGKSAFRFALMRNYGIGWGRSMQILKHLEMHEYAPPPEITPAFKEKVMKIVGLVKGRRYRAPARVI